MKSHTQVPMWLRQTSMLHARRHVQPATMEHRSYLLDVFQLLLERGSFPVVQVGRGRGHEAPELPNPHGPDAPLDDLAPLAPIDLLQVLREGRVEEPRQRGHKWAVVVGRECYLTSLHKQEAGKKKVHPFQLRPSRWG